MHRMHGSFLKNWDSVRTNDISKNKKCRQKLDLLDAYKKVVKCRFTPAI